MTQIVNAALARHSLHTANEPLGYWLYDTPWPVPCTCALFKTYQRIITTTTAIHSIDMAIKG